MLFASDHLEWTYPKNVGLEDSVEKRRLVTVVHEGAPDTALDAFYRYALPEVPPGPPWLHEIAMVDYDYMSDGGKKGMVQGHRRPVGGAHSGRTRQGVPVSARLV